MSGAALYIGPHQYRIIREAKDRTDQQMADRYCLARAELRAVKEGRELLIVDADSALADLVAEDLGAVCQYTDGMNQWMLNR